MKDFDFIFVGDTHSFLDDFIKQEEVINSVDPNFVLCERLEDLKLDSKEKFRKILRKRYISEMISFNEVERLINLCFKKGTNLIGIDLHNLGFNKALQYKIKNNIRLTEEETNLLKEIIRKREKYHLHKILEYKRKTNKPIVVILGCWYLRRDSLIRRKLNSYKIIAPLNKDGEILFKPTNKKVTYGEIIKSHENS